MSVKGLLPLGAAGASALGGLFASDDAEAKVGGVIKNIDKLVAELNRLTKQGVGQRHKSRAAEQVMHSNEFTNYNEMNTFAKDYDGTDAGPYWMEQVGIMADAIDGHPHLSDDAREVLGAWRGEHLARKPGDLAKKREASRNKVHKEQKKADPNNAFGGLKEMMAASAAGAAGSTKAGEMTSPEIRGFQPWSDFEPEPSYWDRVTDPSTYANALMPYFEAGSWLANTPVGKYVGGQVGEAMDAAEIPGRVIQGAGRAGYGVLNGESLPEAFNAGRDTYGNTLAENGEALEQWGIDKGWHEDDASAASTFATYGLDPLTYAGFGLLGKIGGALK